MALVNLTMSQPPFRFWKRLSKLIRHPVVFSLAVDGEAGVKKVLQMLRDEFQLTMALSGCRSHKEITPNHIVTDWDAPRSLPAPRNSMITQYQELYQIVKNMLLHELLYLANNLSGYIQCIIANTSYAEIEHKNNFQA
ncbi:hypothetical protein Leryth_016861 [Lithospermum erythrorhizon]|nr:hypothetical protein Leryth_016861 [Lithospermum erythrorhizon]